MALTPPNWAKDAVPSPEGWRHPRTGELLKSQKLDVTEEAAAPAVQLNEAPANNKALDDMDETEIEAVEEQTGLFKRLTGISLNE